MFIQSEKLSAIAATTTKSKSHKKLKQKKASNRNKNKWTKDTEKKVLKNATEDSQIKRKKKRNKSEAFPWKTIIK